MGATRRRRRRPLHHMPPHISFQKFVHTDEEFSAALKFKGLVVCEIASTWCGTCKSMAPTLQKIALDSEEKPVSFICAMSDEIAALEEFKGKPVPHFKLYKDGEEIESIQGANLPLIQDKILLNIP